MLISIHVFTITLTKIIRLLAGNWNGHPNNSGNLVSFFLETGKALRRVLSRAYLNKRCEGKAQFAGRSGARSRR